MPNAAVLLCVKSGLLYDIEVDFSKAKMPHLAMAAVHFSSGTGIYQLHFSGGTGIPNSSASFLDKATNNLKRFRAAWSQLGKRGKEFARKDI
jgi:hypothetical protein